MHAIGWRGSVMLLMMVMVLTGCAYKVETVSVPAFNTVTSFDAKVPGRWLLYIDADRLDAVLRPRDMNCAAYTFPVAMKDGFQGTIRQTLANLIESTTEISTPQSVESAKKAGNRGIIIVRGERLDGYLQVLPGFWNARLATDVTLTATVTVDSGSGRLFGQTFDARGRSETDVGFACAGGAPSARLASEDAMKDMARRIGEAISNSERVRTAR